MGDLKLEVERLFRILGKDPEAIVLSFLTGDAADAGAMVEEARALIPGRRHYAAGLGFQPDINGVTGIALRPGSTWGIYRELRRRFSHFRIGMAPVLFTADPQFRPLRRAAFLLAPGKILAYNARGERHHLRFRSAVASMLFLCGTPLDRIYLRPWWLCPWKRDHAAIPSNYRIIEGRPLSPGRPRIAVISPYFPYPLSHGGAVRMFNLLREAAREFDLFLFGFQEDGAPEEYSPVLEFCCRVILFPKPRYREPGWSSWAPPEVGEYNSPPMRRLIEEIRRRDDLRLVQVEHTQLADYKGDVLVEHDVTQDLYQQVHRRRPTLASWWDWWRWSRFETRAVRRFRRVVVMSEKDARMLPAGNIAVIPNGVDLDRFSPEPEPEPNGQRLLFIGPFRHFPNVIAFRFLAEEVWPLLIGRFPGLRLTVVPGPDALVHWRNYAGTASPPTPGWMRLLEFVADVRPLYREANLVVVPTLVSAGTNVKVLEAMAMERAIVSTSSGCAGLGLDHGRHIWVADEAPSFADGIARLISDPGLRARIASEARRLALTHFDWRQLGQRQRQLWRELLGSVVIIRPAAQEDLTRIAEIQAASPPAAQWAAPSYLAYDCRVATVSDRVAGFLVLRSIEGEHEILNLAIAPELRRRGIATQLIQNAIQTCGGPVFLEVRESNGAARSLYERLGFNPVAVRRSYYSDPEESAIVMRF